jgi:hypothetical protein
MCAYGLIMLLILLLLISAWRNCPAGLCLFGFLLIVLLTVFSVLPLVYTVAVIALRDGCANVEVIAQDILTKGGFGLHGLAGAPNGTNPAVLALDYYFGDPAVNQNRSAADVILGVVDVAALKAQVNSSVNDALDGIQRDFEFRPKVSARETGFAG